MIEPENRIAIQRYIGSAEWLSPGGCEAREQAFAVGPGDAIYLDIANAVLFFATNELISGAVLDYEQLPVGAPHDLGI